MASIRSCILTSIVEYHTCSQFQASTYREQVEQLFRGGANTIGKHERSRADERVGAEREIAASGLTSFCSVF